MSSRKLNLKTISKLVQANKKNHNYNNFGEQKNI